MDNIATAPDQTDPIDQTDPMDTPNSSPTFNTIGGSDKSDSTKSTSGRKSKIAIGMVSGLVVLAVAAILSGYYLYDQAVNNPVQPSGEAVVITIPQGATTSAIADQLSQAELIQHPTILALYLKLNPDQAQLQAGDFTIPQNISIKDLVKRLNVAVNQQAILTFREGLRREEMAEIIQQAYQAGEVTFTGQQFSDLALNPSPAMRQKLGDRLPAEASLQGYLFPDTYHIDQDAPVEKLFDKMLSNYLAKVTPDIQAGFAQQNLTEYQALTLASIVERESFAGDERPIISQIMFNRLAAGEILGADATVQYAVGYSQEEKRWWKQGITSVDLQIDSPYNTRRFTGLPPAPIANPGLDAIKAVASPQPTNYFYYLHDSQGNIHYAQTLAQHEANIAKYLR